jgi:hypothetical protein
MPDDDDTQTPPGGTPPVPPAAPPAPPTRVIGRGGDEIPEERVSEIRARERRKFNKENYGTEDEDEVAKIKARNLERLKKADELEAEAEKTRLANLSEADRLKEELRIEREQRASEKAKLERERDEAKSTVAVERQDVLINGIAVKHVAAKFVKVANVDLAAHVESLTKKQQAELTPESIEKWFKAYVKENPEFKIPAPAVAKTPEELEAEAKERAARPPAVPPKRAPIGAPRPGARPPTPAPRPATGPGVFKGKTIKQMNKKEFADYMKSQGRKVPY